MGNPRWVAQTILSYTEMKAKSLFQRVRSSDEALP